MYYEAKYVNGHVEVFDVHGVFQFSADTMSEARKEMGEENDD